MPLGWQGNGSVDVNYYLGVAINKNSFTDNTTQEH